MPEIVLYQIVMNFSSQIWIITIYILEHIFLFIFFICSQKNPNGIFCYCICVSFSILHVRFVAHEAELMRFKLSIASKQEISNFMKINDLRYVDVDEDEMSRLSSQLSAVTFGSERSVKSPFYLRN